MWGKHSFLLKSPGFEIMNRKIVFGILLLFLFSLSFLYITSSTNFGNPQKNAINCSTTLNTLGVTVTSPPDLNLNYGDTTNHTISWNLINSGPFNYLGLYSFSTDADGTVPAGWTRPYHSSSTDGKIISAKAGHGKVIEMYDNNPSGYTILRNDFTGQKTGTIEWWFYGTKAGPDSNFQMCFFNTPGVNGILLIYSMITDDLYYYDNASRRICDLPCDNWHHFRMPFNCTTSKFDLWVDGVLRITSANFVTPRTNISRIELYTGGGTTGGFYVYFDAFDFSWAPGYFLNRNMNYEPSPTDYYGLYSFTTDSDGSVPTGWTRPYHDSNTDGSIIAEQAGHRKVIALYDNNPAGYTVLRNTFSPQTTGTV